MSTSTPTERDQQSFAEDGPPAGAVKPRRKPAVPALSTRPTSRSNNFSSRSTRLSTVPSTKLSRQNKVPSLNKFAPPPLAVSHPSDKAMEASIEVTRKRREAGTLFDENGKLQPSLLQELADAGYWGMLIESKYGGQGAPFARFTHFTDAHGDL